jgi:uracil-DNA glycosylase family 4
VSNPKLPGSNPKVLQLAALADKIIADKVCPELAASATQLVFADGSPDADIVFIGEAPGKSEDEQGKPFVGAAGKFLNEMLASIGLSREEVYITNIVKYRPPENRDPLPEEKQAFMPYLISQLDIIAPKLTIFLGRHAMSVFFPSLRITQAHGKALRSKGRVYMPLYHPAAALYNGSMRATLLEDFARIPVILEKLRDENEHISSSDITDTTTLHPTLF